MADDIENRISEFDEIKSELVKCRQTVLELRQVIQEIAHVHIYSVPHELVALAESVLLGIFCYMSCFVLYVMYMCI